MCHRDALVVALEKGEEVLRQIVFVAVGERADNAEIERNIFAVVYFVGGDEDIARMHVGVEKAVAKNLSEKDFDTRAR